MKFHSISELDKATKLSCFNPEPAFVGIQAGIPLGVAENVFDGYTYISLHRDFGSRLIFDFFFKLRLTNGKTRLPIRFKTPICTT